MSVIEVVLKWIMTVLHDLKTFNILSAFTMLKKKTAMLKES
jgi:hypothetical protein